MGSQNVIETSNKCQQTNVNPFYLRSGAIMFRGVIDGVLLSILPTQMILIVCRLCLNEEEEKEK